MMAARSKHVFQRIDGSGVVNAYLGQVSLTPNFDPNDNRPNHSVQHADKAQVWLALRAANFRVVAYHGDFGEEATNGQHGHRSRTNGFGGCDEVYAAAAAGQL